jgi:hypothetical protein
MERRNLYLVILLIGIISYNILNITWPNAPDTPAKSITLFGADTAKEDNATAINAAIQDSSHVTVPGGEFSIQSNIVLKSGLYLEGTSGLSKIVIDDTFKKNVYFPGNEFAIFNSGFAQSYNEATAAEITLKGITFVLTKSTINPIQTIMGFGNVKSLVIENCDFICQGNIITASNLDLYAACKNVTIRNCTFKNDTGADSGGCIWVRNFTSDGANLDNETANILIEGNSFEKNCGDEVIAVWGLAGQVRNVDVKNNTIRTYGTKPALVTAIFGGEFDRYATAIAKDIVFEGNKITTDDFGGAVVQVGQPTDQISKVDNVKVINNTINAKVSATGVANAIKLINQPNYTNLSIMYNTINNTGTVKLNYGIVGAGPSSEVSNNTVNGAFNAGIANCHKALLNKVNNNLSGAAFENCLNVDSNEVTNCLVGIKCFYSETFTLTNNTITMADNAKSFGIMVLNVSDSSPTVFAKNNTIIRLNTSSIVVFRNGGTYMQI